MSTTADTLRQRARTLRQLANSITNTSFMDLGQWVGPDTWMGPSPTACAERVEHFRGAFNAHGDDLRARANKLERQADQAEADEQRRRLNGPI
jgi:hypothetical protein